MFPIQHSNTSRIYYSSASCELYCSNSLISQPSFEQVNPHKDFFFKVSTDFQSMTVHFGTLCINSLNTIKSFNENK